MIRVLLLLALLFAAFPAHAEELDYSYFSRIPVLHEGRIKPLGSFAQVELRRFSGRDTMEGETAEAWLAATLFDPADALDQKLFLVRSAEARQAVALPEHEDHRYSLQEVTLALERQRDTVNALLQKDEHSLTIPERELVRLYANANEAAELLRSFSLLLPMQVPEPLQASFGLPADADYLKVVKFRETLLDRVKKLLKEKGEAIGAYSRTEQQEVLFAMRLNVLEATGETNKLLRVLPSPWKNGEWFSPWAMLLDGKATPQTGEALELWRRLADAYRADDAEAWQIAAKALYERAPVPRWKLELEHWYYGLRLAQAATLLYAIAFVLLLCSPLAGEQPRTRAKRAGRGVGGKAPVMALTLPSPVNRRGFIPHRSGLRLRVLPLKGGVITLAAALFVHAAILLSRILILGRPPVSTLYESILFVSFIVAAASFLWPGENFRRERRIAASGIGALLLLISNTYAADSDTMGVLIAVLNTNFWLGTHVLCITAGYGWCLIAGTLAHFSLFKEARRTKGRLPKAPPGYLVTLSIVALMFTSLGTILGGIWADQSWGRFWGWDPKENGALLIVLWLIWLLHGRVSTRFGNAGFTALLALVNMVVAISWFGVNLLNTGLHSYGFTHAAAWGLGAFCITELLFVSFAYGLARRRA